MIKTIITLIAIIVTFCSIIIAKPAIAVLNFTNLGNEKSDRYARAISQMISIDLSNLQGITIVDRENLDAIMKENVLIQTGMATGDEDRVGELKVADYIISGSVVDGGKSIIGTYKIVSAINGSIVSGGTVTDNDGKVFRLKNNLVTKIANSLTTVATIDTKELNLPNDDLENSVIEGLGESYELSEKGFFAKAKELLFSMDDAPKNFIYRDNEIKALNKRIKQYDKEHEKFLSSYNVNTMNQTEFLTSSSVLMGNFEMRKLLVLCDKTIEFHPNDNGIKEYAEYFRLTALKSLGEISLYLEGGESFLKNYPASMYYTMIKNDIMNLANQQKKQKKEIDIIEKKNVILVESLKFQTGIEREKTLFSIASSYMSASAFTRALQYFNQMDFKEAEKAGFTGDTILLMIVTCHYRKGNSKMANTVLSILEEKYPDSDAFSTAQSMIMYMPK